MVEKSPDNRLEAALTLIRRGFQVFPLADSSRERGGGESKRPREAGWQQAAMNEAEAFDFWLFNPDANIAINCAGLIVLDVDVRAGKQGLASLTALTEAHGPLPETMIFATGSGGFHYLFRGDGHNTAGRLGLGIDTRGAGGYIVAPGSFCPTLHSKPYRIASDRPIADAPGWLIAALAEKTRKEGHRDAILAEDDERDVEAAIAFLRARKPAIQGQGGDEHTYVTFARLREMGIGADKALELVLENFNERCSPPWQPEELAIKCGNAYSYSQRPQGAASITQRPAGSVVLGEGEFFIAPVRDVKPDGAVKIRRPIYGDLLFPGRFSLGIAAPGTGKTTLGVSHALALSSGRNLLGSSPVRPRRTLYLNAEDDTNELELRLSAAMRFYDVDFQELLETDDSGMAIPRLFFQGSDGTPFKLAERRDGKVCATGTAQKLFDFIRQQKIEAVILDPLIELHTLDENSNIDMLAFAGIIREMAAKADAAFMIFHHDRKPPVSDSTGHIGNMYAGRGASALVGAARVVFTMYNPTNKDCLDFGISDAERKTYIRMDVAKATFAKNASGARWLRHASVQIGPDDIGVITRADMGKILAIAKEKDTDMLKASLLEIFTDTTQQLTLNALAETLVEFPEFAEKSRKSRARTVNQFLKAGGKLDDGRSLITEQQTRNGKLVTVVFLKVETQ